MNLPALDTTIKRAFTAARHERGIGDGFYQVGHDLRISHNDRDEMQLAADALRLAALSIDADSMR